MSLLLRKKLLWLIVIWFALLQTVAPFIHAHFEGDATAQGQGLHMHELSLTQLPDDEHTLKNVAMPVHTIGVDQALVKSLDLLPAPILIVLFAICFALLVARYIRFNFTPQFQHSLYLRSLSRPRAPPAA